MRVLVTGGTGHLGSWLVKALDNSGHEVVMLAREPRTAEFLKSGNVTILKGDITSKESLEAAMKGVDQVYHLAACVAVWARDNEIFRKINVGGTENVMEAAVRAGVKRVLITSSAGNFGPSNEGIVTEKSIRSVPFFTEYERSKNEADEVALQYLGKTEVVIVYPTRVYGPVLKGPAASVSLVIERIVNGGFRFVPSTGLTVGNYVYIEDVVQGFLLAMEKGVPGEKYILGGHNHTLLDVYRAAFQALDRPPVFFHLPVWMLKSIISFEQFATVFGKKPVMTKDWLAKLMLDWVVSSDKAVKELGYTITPLQSGIGKTVASFKKK